MRWTEGFLREDDVNFGRVMGKRLGGYEAYVYYRHRISIGTFDTEMLAMYAVLAFWEEEDEARKRHYNVD